MALLFDIMPRFSFISIIFVFQLRICVIIYRIYLISNVEP